VTVQGINRTPGQRIILSKQVVQDLHIRIATIAEQSDRTGNEPVELTVFAEETRGNVSDAVNLNSQQLLLVQHVHDLGDYQVHSFRGIGKSQNLFTCRNSTHRLVEDAS